MKKYICYIIRLIVILCNIVVCILSVPYNIDSLCDEGYLWQCIQNAMNGKVHGGSLWANMIVTLLGNRMCSSILLLRVANVVLSIVSALLFWLITRSFVSNNKLSSFAYLITIMLALTPIGGIVLNYNGVSRLLLLFACAALFRMFTNNTGKRNLIWAFLVGFALMFSFFSILPSAVMVGGTVGILLLIKFWKQWKKMLRLFSIMFAGAVFALIITHFFVMDLRTVVASMTDTAQTITKVDRGYDPISFIISVLLFFRDISLFLLLSSGIILISLFLKRNGYSWFASVFFIVSCLVYWHYQEKPSISFGMQLSLMWLLPLICKCNEKHLPHVKQLLTVDFVLNIFLCLFPLLAVLGTNVYIGSKMSWFIIPWVLLGWRLGFGEEKMQFRGETMFVLSMVVLLGVYRQTKVIDASQTIVDTLPLKGMHLNARQESHFKKVEQILDDYQFQRGESVVFSTQLSMMTICYLEALPVGLYFQPNDFVAHIADTLPIPDYLFLSEYDVKIAKEKLEKMPWGWPQEFDFYKIGSPDDESRTDYPIERSLYCRSSLKK